MALNGYTAQDFIARIDRCKDGQCVYCGGATERDMDGYDSSCSRCFELVWKGKEIRHSHMFSYNVGGAHPTTVDMHPAFVAGVHVGWYCPGGHGDGPCAWTLTDADAQPHFAAYNAWRASKGW